MSRFRLHNGPIRTFPTWQLLSLPALTLLLFGVAQVNVVYGDKGPCDNSALYTDNTLSLIFKCGPGQTRTWTDLDGNRLVVHCDESGNGGFTATFLDPEGHPLTQEHLDKNNSDCPFYSPSVSGILWDCFPGRSNGWRNDLDGATIGVRCQANGKIEVVWAYDPSLHVSGTGDFDGRCCPVSATHLSMKLYATIMSLSSR